MQLLLQLLYEAGCLFFTACMSKQIDVGMARTVYIYVYIHHVVGEFQAIKSEYTPYIYGSGQLLVYAITR